MIKYLKLLLGFVCLLNTHFVFAQKGKIENKNATPFYVLINELSNEILIDVRDSAAYSGNQIDNAVNLDNKEKLTQFTDTLDKETPMLVYCSVGFRSKQVSKLLIDLGFEKIYNLKGGIRKWISHDYPIIEKYKE